jgi:hypothetical protein
MLPKRESSPRLRFLHFAGRMAATNDSFLLAQIVSSPRVALQLFVVGPLIGVAGTV